MKTKGNDRSTILLQAILHKYILIIKMKKSLPELAGALFTKKSSFLVNPADYCSFLILKGRIWLRSGGFLGGVVLSLPTVAYVITGLVLKGLVWGRRWQVQVHFPLVGCWVHGWSSLAPLGCLLLGSDCQRRGVRNPSEESYSKDISKSADFFLQFSFMNLRFGETTFTCTDRSILLK